jgi:hypothetical protein
VENPAESAYGREMVQVGFRAAVAPQRGMNTRNDRAARRQSRHTDHRIHEGRPDHHGKIDYLLSVRQIS